MPEWEAKPGYYTVSVPIGDRHVPYIVFARSDFDAAHKVKEETGYPAKRDEVEGPHIGYKV
jgi:hypothetical protein